MKRELRLAILVDDFCSYRFPVVRNDGIISEGVSKSQSRRQARGRNYGGELHYGELGQLGDAKGLRIECGC